MKKWMLEQLKLTVASLASKTVKKFKPTIVAVTGSVGKTSTKEAIYSVLSAYRRVRKNVGNFNGELGLPLTILGDWSENDLRVIARDSKNISTAKKAIFFIRVVLVSMLRLALPRFLVRYIGGYPEILVLEYAADKPGDIKYLLEIAKPQISILTAIGDVPVHVEFYDSPEAVLREKVRIIEALPAAGLAILNADEPRVLSCEEKTRATVLSFGFHSNADIQIKDFENKIEMIDGVLRPTGIIFKIGYEGSFVPVRIGGTLGRTQAYSAAVACSVGMAFNLNLVQIAEALTYYQVPHQRMRFLAGVHHSTLVDDSYNASPLSMQSAIETMSSIKGSRKIAILGDMRELGSFSKQAHHDIGLLAARVFSVIIAVGPEAGEYVVTASKHRVAKKNLLHVERIEEVLPVLRDYIKEGDIVLIKGSHSMALEKAVVALQEI